LQANDALLSTSKLLSVCAGQGHPALRAAIFWRLQQEKARTGRAFCVHFDVIGNQIRMGMMM
jgi:hypothetical protein